MPRTCNLPRRHRKKIGPSIVLAASGRALYRYQNGGWQGDSNAAPTAIDSLAFTSSAGGWAFGKIGDSTYGTDRCQVLSYAGGQWTLHDTPVIPGIVGAPIPCGDVALAGSQSGWIVDTSDWRLDDPERVRHLFLPLTTRQ